MLENNKIAIIGAGHIGQALLEGLLNSEISRSNFIVTHPSSKHLKKISKKYGIKVTTNNNDAVKEAYYIFIAVKPFIIKEVIEEIKNEINNKILLSVAAAVNINLLESYSGNSRLKIIRLMPNMPIAKNHGVIGFYPNRNVNKIDEKAVDNLISGLGQIIRVKKEADLDILTLVSACGPAIVSYFIDLLAKYGQANGFLINESVSIATKTFEGALIYLKNSKQNPTKLKDLVSTKGGVTEIILTNLINKKIDIQFNNSLNKGFSKINEIKCKLHQL